MDIVDPTAEPTGFEFTPKMQSWLIGGGALLYLGIIGLGLVVQTARIEQRGFNPSVDLVRSGQVDRPVNHDVRFGFIAAP
jgi:hypothetical protein